MWNGAGSPPPNFFEELYAGDDLEEVEELEVEEFKVEELEVEEPVEDDEENESYSPLTSPRARSRSPLVRVAPLSSPPSVPLNSAGVVIRIYDEDGVNLEDRVREDGFGETVQRDEQDNVGGEHHEFEFLTPDAHVLYATTNERMDVESANGDESRVIDDRGALDDRSGRRMRARSVRGQARGVRGRGRRGRGVGGGRRRREAEAWAVGHPLEQIWVTDDDVPLELREMAMAVVRRRNTSARSTLERRRTNEEDESESENEDYEDAIDGSNNSQFEWSPMETFQIREEIFTPEQTGSVTSFSSPYDAFRSYWDESILHMIVEETNRYASKISSNSFQAEWYATNSHEVLCLFAFWMMLGVIRMPTIASCFSTHYLLKTEIFRYIFTIKRYRNLVRALHFIDSDPSYNAASTSTNDIEASSDRIYLLRPIINHLNAKFQANYVLSRDICIDESLTLWKVSLNIKQYIRSKAAKFGIKTFELCESATGYLWSFVVYTGKESDNIQRNSTDLKSTALVKNLIAPLLHKGYRLFMDNWFNSPLLARFLKSNGTDCVGTLRSCRRGVPPIIKCARLKQGQFVARHAGDLCIISWQDKKRINMISTCHGVDMGLAPTRSSQPNRRPAFKPRVVLDYNKSMGGVDLKDQMLEPYLLERKRCAKWYMKLFKRLLNVSIQNARILFKSSLQQSVDNLDFRLRLADAIVEKHLPHCPRTRDPSSRHRPITSPHYLNHQHWPVSIPASTSRMSANRKGVLSCVVCSANKTRKTTSYKCETCNVPLCVETCFRVYHTS